MKKNKQLYITAPVDPVILGNIGSAYGIRGWLKVCSSTEKEKNIFDYQPWFTKHAGEWRLIQLRSWKYHNKNLIIKVKDIRDRKAATMLTNCKIFVDASQLPNLDNGEYYWKDLLGCLVITIDGYKLGKVFNLIKTGSNDVLVLKGTVQDTFRIKELLIPFLYSQVIKDIDIKKKIIKVEWDPVF